jgi:ATP-dependent DNA helicase
MTAMLDIISHWLTYNKNFDHVRIDGTVGLDERQSRISEFQTNPKLSVFLLSTRAGGLGINLTAADTVIIFDSDWNPQVDLQAQDRVHRIGQTKPVIIYRFVTEKTVEKHILDRAKAKRNLEKIVIHKSNQYMINLDEFKGSKSYYQNKNVNVINIAEILKEEAISAESFVLDSRSGDIITPESILSEDDLLRITDRSKEAYQMKSLESDKFAVVEENAEANNVLANMNQ